MLDIDIDRAPEELLAVPEARAHRQAELERRVGRAARAQALFV